MYGLSQHVREHYVSVLRRRMCTWFYSGRAELKRTVYITHHSMPNSLLRDEHTSAEIVHSDRADAAQWLGGGAVLPCLGVAGRTPAQNSEAWVRNSTAEILRAAFAGELRFLAPLKALVQNE